MLPGESFKEKESRRAVTLLTFKIVPIGLHHYYQMET